ncbi:MAG TPA: hypothetical protein VMW17_20320 [Candidatus Binatia bacterium]|nr:hypothetical protein [Candidatus Binatia bacterium]
MGDDSPAPSLTVEQIEALQPVESVGLTQRLCRPVSKHVTRVLLRLRVPAAAVSAANIAVGVFAAACLGCPHLGVALCFVPLMYLGEVLDCCDGEVARGSGTADATFFFADVAAHYFVTPLVVLALGLHVAMQQQAMAPLLIGAIAAIFCSPTITLYRVRASMVLEELLARAERGPVAVHPLLATRAGRLAGDFGFDRPTHHYRIPLGTGVTVALSVGLLVEVVAHWPALRWLLWTLAVAFPFGRVYDYASTIREGKPARELRRILGAP